MSSESHSAVVATLEAGRQDMIAALRGLTDEQAATKPASDRWCVIECIEHVAIVEDRFLTLFDAAKPIDTLGESSMTDDQRAAMMADRGTKRQAPEAVVPSGRFATIAEAMRHFELIRDRSIQAARQHGPQLFKVGVNHPRFGAMNGAQLLHLLHGHAARHTAQMRETRTDLGY